MSPFFTNGTTFYKNIHSIKPGENIYLDLNTFEIKFHSITRHYENNIDFKKNLNLVEENFNYEFNSAVNLRLQTDRKASVLLSGGVDSSLIASFIKKDDLEKLVFYNIHSSNEEYKNSDLYYSRILAKNLGIKLNEISSDIEFNEFDQIFHKLSKQQENPINLFATALPTFLISSKMKFDNMHIALDGVGGDEIMGGFPVFSSLATASLRNKQYMKSINYINQFLKHNDFNLVKNIKYLLKIMYSGILDHNFLSNSQKRNLSLLEILSNKLIKKEITDITLKNERDNLFSQFDRQNHEIEKGGVPYYLGVSDSSNMINTVESRSPFLDTRLNKYINLPDELKFNNGYNKFFLRSVLSKRLPKEIAWRKNKKGFTTHGVENYTQNNKSIEKILDSKIVREIIDKKVDINNLKKNKKAINSLLPLAILNDIYDLHI
jgi:asparagine synthase (glutamine-hydrolysing)